MIEIGQRRKFALVSQSQLMASVAAEIDADLPVNCPGQGVRTPVDLHLSQSQAGCEGERLGIALDVQGRGGHELARRRIELDVEFEVGQRCRGQRRIGQTRHQQQYGERTFQEGPEK